MTITTYGGLQAACARYARRTDIANEIIDAITLAEDRISKELQSWRLEYVATLTTVSGTAEVDLPSNCRLVEWVRLSGDNERTLTELPHETFYDLYAGATDGVPRHYYKQAGQIVLGATPNAVFTLYAKLKLAVDALTTGNPTNDILTNYPALYLHGTLVEVYRLIRHDERLAASEQAYQQALMIANGENIKRKSSGVWAARKDKRIP